jgi:hypothetical protein
MAKERAIDLQLIKPVDLGSSGGKGKMSLRNLFKQELTKLGVPFTDPCCTIPELYKDIFPDVFTLPLNFATQSIVPFTTFNAPGMVTAATGAYDKFTVPAASSNTDKNTTGTIFRLDSTAVSSNVIQYKIKLKANSVGATNPMFGFFLLDSLRTGDIDGISRLMYVDFKGYLKGGSNGVPAIVTWPHSQFSHTVQESQFQDITTKRGGIGTPDVYITAGDIVNLTWQLDARNLTERITFLNESTGAFVEALINLPGGTTRDVHTTYGYVHNIGFMISDGTYTVLDLKADHLAKRGIKVMVIGDSMGRGSTITGSESLAYKLDKIYPEDTSNSANGGAYIYNINRAQMKDVINLQPKFTFVFSFIPSLYTHFVSTDPNYATFTDAWGKMIKGILGVNSVPVLVKVPVPWPIGIAANPAQVEAWNSFLESQVKLYPGTQILDLSEEKFSWDSTGFHFSGSDNEIIAKKIEQLVTNYERNQVV